MPLSERDMLLLDCFMYSTVTPQTEAGTYLKDMVESCINGDIY